MKDEFVDINVVPLVDIMLVLIVIVLMTANFMVQGMLPVKPPQSDTDSSPLSESIVLSISAVGDMYYERKPLPPEQLETRLQGLDTERPVLINADRDLTLQPFVTLLDRLKKLGFTKISVQTEQ